MIREKKEERRQDKETFGTAVQGVGSSLDRCCAEGGECLTLTARQGHPVYDNQNLRTVGSRGPTTLENYHFLEKITHFDRERISERAVHARGAGAHGCFEAYGKLGNEPIAKYTRAKFLQAAGSRSPAGIRAQSEGGDSGRRHQRKAEGRQGSTASGTAQRTRRALLMRRRATSPVNYVFESGIVLPGSDF